VAFPETTAKYLRVVCSPLKAIPAWHVMAAGKPAFIFVDELIVE
jgi:hexosaminidase